MSKSHHRVITLVAMAVLSMTGARVAQATLLVYDSFNQNAGTALGATTLDTTNPNTNLQSWQPLGGSLANDNTISASGLSFPGSYSNAPANIGNAVNVNMSAADHIVLNSSMGSPPSSFQDGAGNLPAAFYSLLVNVPSASGALSAASLSPTSTQNHGLIAAFSDGTGVTGTLGTQTAGLYIAQGAGGGFELGIGAGSQNNATIAFSGNLTAGQTYFVVGNYDSSTGVASLWINPTLGLNSAPAASETSSGGNSGGFGNGTINSFALTYISGTEPTGGVLVDELRIGTTWADVTPTHPVPEPSSLVLVGLAAFGLLVAARRRRKA